MTPLHPAAFARANRIITAVIVALTVAAVALVAWAVGPALADTRVPDPDARASLTITRYEMESGDRSEGTGLEDPAIGAGRTPIAGAEYRIHRALAADGTEPDLTTEAGWLALEAMDLTPRHVDAPQATGVTGPDGVLTLSDLPIGAYWVVEASQGPDPSHPIAQPFLVTLPMTHPVDRDRWIHDVHVYPKSQAVRFSKTVEQGDARAPGDILTWRIATRIPLDPITSAEFTDPLDPRLAHAGHSVVIEPAGLELAEGRHYTFEDRDGTLHYALTKTGVTVAMAHPGQELVVRLRTAVHAELGDHDGLTDIPNSATLALDGAVTTALIAQSVPTKWGSVDLEVCDECTGEPLTGGSFRLYRTAADAEVGRNPIAVDGDDVFEIGADGRVRVTGLAASNWRDGAFLPESQWHAYHLVEVDRPARLVAGGASSGVESLSGPVPVYVVDNDEGVDVRIAYVDPQSECARQAAGDPDATDAGPGADPGTGAAAGAAARAIPMTGAQIAGLGGAAVALLALGWLLVTGRRRVDA